MDTSSSELFVFDATCVFDVETCSPALDSYKELATTGLESGVIEDVMDLEDTSIVWTVENPEAASGTRSTCSATTT